MDQQGNVANPARGPAELNRGNHIFLSPFAPGNLISRDDFDRPAPRQPANSYTQAEPDASAARFI